jgi:excisionase family DNA binding protein
MDDASSRSPIERETGRVLDVDGAAQYLGVTTRFIRRLIQERRVPFYKVGRFVRLDPADLDELLRSGRVEARSMSIPARDRLGREDG